MIRQLRRKFVAMTMALVGAVLLGICVVMLFFTARQQRGDTMSALYRAIDQPGIGQQKPEITKRAVGALDLGALGGSARPGVNPGGGGTENRAVFWAVTDSTGTITQSNVESVDITEDTLAALVAEVLASGKESGSIQNPYLRYLTQNTPDGTKIAFADSTAELAALRSIGLRLAGVVAAALLALLGISIYLARMAVRPVEQAWEQQRQFVADASHELKTPLTVIMADASIVQAHPGDTVAEQQKWLDGIQAEGARMKKLVDALLFLARADAARAPVALGRVDLSDTVMSSSLSFESVAFEGGITLETQVAPGVAMQGDGGQLKQLVAILVDNACKYATGEKVVTVRLRAQGQNALLQVENTGADIPPEELPHLFERFYRADRSRARSAGGYGLGLAIARAITQQHHGGIKAESGGGATVFSVLLPLGGGKAGNGHA
ncbi:MAG: HAMP domain-containing sensor histidine kinase [Gemmiger sp.]|nr:HAMP domain-containing sensor histidine kinase [Gemmiger sp.]